MSLNQATPNSEVIETRPVQSSNPTHHPLIQDNSVAVIFAVVALIHAIAKLLDITTKSFIELIGTLKHPK